MRAVNKQALQENPGDGVRYAKLLRIAILCAEQVQECAAVEVSMRVREAKLIRNCADQVEASLGLKLLDEPLKEPGGRSIGIE
jgi:hypothetical protein